jgi:hypothetical protein
MRILLIERRVAARYNSTVVNGAANARHHFTETGDAEANDEADEDDALLPEKEEEQLKYRKSKTGLFAACQFCTVSPTRVYRLFCWWLFARATLLATFDTTIPTEAEASFDLSPFYVGLMSIALDVLYLLLGPVAGLAVDKYGTKPAAVFGFGYVVPALVLLRMAHAGGENQIILYSAFLALCGVGMAVIRSLVSSKPQIWFRNMTRRIQGVSENKDHTHSCTVSILSFFAPDSHRVR